MKKTNISTIKKDINLYIDKNLLLEGRVSSIRSSKNFNFLDLFSEGSKIQCSLTKDQLLQVNTGDLIEIKGVLYYTKTNEPTIKISNLKIVNKWNASIGFKDITKTNGTPLKSFEIETYKKTLYPNLLRKSIREYFDNLDFMEVQTPILGKNFNGGRSFPVTSSYKGNVLGFNRTTFEDRMQALIGAGYKRIYQIGSVFRSESENVFLEGYATEINWDDGKSLIKNMFSKNVKDLIDAGIGEHNKSSKKILDKEWLELDLFDEVKNLFNIDNFTFINDIEKTKQTLIKNKVFKSNEISVENIADEVANYIAQQYDVPVIVDSFPIWSSPLYKENSEGKLFRCRLYLPPLKGGFELGIQENNYEKFISRVEKQREKWSLTSDDERILDSDLEKIISGGLPEMLGFGLSPDRLLKLWENNYSIDPYV